MKWSFELRSELQVAKCLIVHVLSSSYNVSRIELRNKRRPTQQGSLCVANDIVLDQVGVYHERVYADNVISNSWFVKSLPSQHYYKFITNITSENVSQMRTKECQTGSFIFEVNFSFLSFGDTLILIQFPLWLCLSWMRMSMASTISVMEGWRPCSS